MRSRIPPILAIRRRLAAVIRRGFAIADDGEPIGDLYDRWCNRTGRAEVSIYRTADGCAVAASSPLGWRFDARAVNEAATLGAEPRELATALLGMPANGDPDRLEVTLSPDEAPGHALPAAWALIRIARDCRRRRRRRGPTPDQDRPLSPQQREVLARARRRGYLRQKVFGPVLRDFEAWARENDRPVVRINPRSGLITCSTDHCTYRLDGAADKVLELGGQPVYGWDNVVVPRVPPDLLDATAARLVAIAMECRRDAAGRNPDPQPTE